MTTTNVDTEIRKLVEALNQQGKGIPMTIHEINDDLPYAIFSDLLRDFKSGNAQLLRFSYAMDSSLFSMLASTSDSIKSNLGLFISYGGILAVIIASFIYSWWLLFAVPVAFVVGSSITKNAYNNAIFNAAFTSEIAFCFLYFIRQVSVYIPKINKQFYYQSE